MGNNEHTKHLEGVIENLEEIIKCNNETIESYKKQINMMIENPHLVDQVSSTFKTVRHLKRGKVIFLKPYSNRSIQKK